MSTDEYFLPDSDALSDLLADALIPRWAAVRLRHSAERLEDVATAVAAQFEQPGVGDQIWSEARVALTAGSRGIDRIDEVLAASVTEIRRRGGVPFIVPAMGSHGGASVAGQMEILARYGITEERMGCPIRASMEVVELAQLPGGERVFTDRIARTEADVIIPVARVKPHTAFHGPFESGLYKMLAVGLGNQHGADSLHARGVKNFSWLIPAAARLVVEHLPVPFGIALVENGYGQLALLEAIVAAAIEKREPELLEEARRFMARLPVEQLDVLVVDRIGKDISGTGMDPNVLGRYYDAYLNHSPFIQRVVVLDLTDATRGNATGIGMADFCTQRAASKIDRLKTYMNQLTAKRPEGARLPLVAPNDRAAIQMAIVSLQDANPHAIRLMRIRDTKDLDQIWVSEALLPDVLATGYGEQLGELASPAFDGNGNLF